MISLRGLDPQLRPYAEYAMELARQYELAPVVTSVYRPWADQQRLYTRYLGCLRRGEFDRPLEERELGCRYPANRPGDSAHNFGWAWDSWVPDDQLALWVAIRRYIGWEVLDHDPIHAQLPNWRGYV